jgi:Flp pilus assembly protein TadD
VKSLRATRLSLALLEFLQNRIAAAKQTLQQGQTRVPGSGKIYWGLGLAAVLEGETATASDDLERAVALLPEWPASYSTLGFFYFQTGQLTKAREVLERFRNNGAPGGLDLQRIESALNGATDHPLKSGEVMGMKERLQVFQLAEYLADKTL